MNNSIKQTENLDNKIYTGLALLIIGGIFLIRNLGAEIPHWIISWPMLLIVIGLASGAKQQYKKPGAFILIGLGLLFLLKKFFFVSISVFPLFLIGLGLWLILKKQINRNRFRECNF